MTSKPTSLLGQLAAKFAVQDEVVATDALAIILRRSDAARAGLRQLLTQLAARDCDVARVSPQDTHEGSGRPDLAVYDNGGALTALVEAKFWAGLTLAQPVGYLRRLEKNRGCTLLFVAPHERLDSLCAALCVRAAGAGSTLTPRSVAQEARSYATSSGTCVGVVSWRRLLTVLSGACSAIDDRRGVTEIEQLGGLVERFESEGFGSMSTSDLSDLTVPRRVRALGRLVQAVINKAEVDGLMPVARGNPYSWSYTWGGRSFPIAGAFAWLGLHHDAWAQYQVSPVWVEFLATDVGRASDVKRALQEWEVSVPQRMFVHEDGRVYIPLFIQAGAEQDEAVSDLVLQLKALADALASALRPNDR